MLGEAIVYILGLFSGYLLRILTVDYEKKYEERKTMNEEVYDRLYNMLFDYSQEWIFDEEEIDNLEQEWDEILGQRRRHIDDSLIEEMNCLINIIYEKRMEFEEHQSRIEYYIERGGDRDENVRYYPVLRRIQPYIMRSNNADELSNHLKNVYNKTDDKDLRDAIRDWEINREENTWSQTEWDQIKKRYESSNLTYYDLDEEEYSNKYHHNLLNELYKQHKLCSEVYDRLEDIIKMVENRANESLRVHALRETIIPDKLNDLGNAR